MAIESNYIGLQQQIADECLDRQDLLAPLSDSGLSLSPIQIAIQAAITKWEREQFYFNRWLLQTPLAGPFPFQTSNGQEYYGATTTPNSYALIPQLASIKKLWVLISQNRYTLNPRTTQYLDDISVNPQVVGQPTEFAYDDEMLRFYPIPDNTYPVGGSGTQRLSALVEPTDANAWTEDGFDLIRCEAKKYLAENTLHDDDIAAKAHKGIYGDPTDPRDRGYLFMLKKESAARQGPIRIRPTHF